MSSSTPGSLARAALDREQQKTQQLPIAALSSAPESLALRVVPMIDGRAYLWDERNQRVVGIAASAQVAEQTRKFFS